MTQFFWKINFEVRYCNKKESALEYLWAKRKLKLEMPTFVRDLALIWNNFFRLPIKTERLPLLMSNPLSAQATISSGLSCATQQALFFRNKVPCSLMSFYRKSQPEIKVKNEKKTWNMRWRMKKALPQRYITWQKNMANCWMKPLLIYMHLQWFANNEWVNWLYLLFRPWSQCEKKAKISGGVEWQR